MNRSEEHLMWYHGKISKEEADELLLSEKEAENGLFLVRDSSSVPGDFALTVLHEGNPIHYQIRRHGDDAFFSIDVNTIFHGLETLIEYYQEDSHGLPLKLGKLCKKDAPPHDSRRHGRTNLLHRATNEGDFKVVSELLKCGYRSLEAKNADGQTAVHLASRHAQNEILRLLIESEASVNCRDTAGYCPLHYACQNNFPTTVRLLVQEGKANVQTRHTDTGWVPLHEAASRGHCEVVKELLALNAPANPRSKTSETPVQLASKNGHIECETLLKEYVAPVPKTQRKDWDHGYMERHEAVSTLTKHGLKDGQFLVRKSQNNATYVLSMVHCETVFHYQIRKRGSNYFIDDGPYLPSLEHVISHYMTWPDGLPVQLLEPLTPPAAPALPEFPSSLNGTLRSTKKPIEKSNQWSTIKPTKSHMNSNVQTFSKFNTLPSNKDNINKNNNQKAVQPVLFPTPCKSLSGLENISRDNIELGVVLGEGEFGSVLKGIYTSDDGSKQEVAVKSLHDEDGTLESAFLEEARLMLSLTHPCIVRLLGVARGQPLLMVQELVPLGSVLNFLLSTPHLASPYVELKRWASQIASGMQYLESQRFVHRDLAARNILLASRDQAKISDFGLSRALSGKEYYRASQGGRWPIKWYAPESYNFGTFTHASDVWSFGVTLWEMYSYGQQPYGDKRGAEVIEMIEKGERLTQPTRCPDNVYPQILKCWSYKPQERPKFTELLEFFNSTHSYENVAIVDPNESTPILV